MARRCVLQCDPEPVERTVGQIKTRGKRSCINFAWEEGRGGGGATPPSSILGLGLVGL